MPLGGRRSFCLSLGHSLARPVGEPCGSISGRARRRKFLPGIAVRQILLSMALVDAGKTDCSCPGSEKVIKASESRLRHAPGWNCPGGCLVSAGALRESLLVNGTRGRESPERAGSVSPHPGNAADKAQ